MKGRFEKGFTLIELIIVVAIIAILAAIAYPSYSQYVIRSNRSAAQQFMLDVAQKQEQYLIDNRTYADTLAKLGMSTPSGLSERYTVQIKDATSTKYTIELDPTGTSQAVDGKLSLNQAGVKTPSDKWK